MDSSSILEGIEVLVKPTSRCASAEAKFDLDSLLVQNVEAARKFCQSKCSNRLNLAVDNVDFGSHVRWQFVEISLGLLDCLREFLVEAVQSHEKTLQQSKDKPISASRAPPLSPDVLSVTQQKHVTTLMQFIVCLGVCPNLQPGVGIPLEKRSGFAQLIKDNVQSDPAVREWRLLRCLSTLLKCITQPSLGSLILSAHLGDMIASLAQLSYGTPNRAKSIENPNVKRQTDCQPRVSCSSSPADVVNLAMKQHDGIACGKSIQNPTDSSVSATNSDQIRENLNGAKSDTGELVSASDRQWCKEELEQLLGRVYPPLVVREMLILQTNMPGFPKVPLWLRRFCSWILSERLMKPRGVQFVLRGMLEGTTGSNNASDWRKCDAAAKVIANCPKSVSVSEYYSKISPQVIELLHIQDKTLARQFLRVATSTVSAMVNSHPDEVKGHLTDLLLRPLITCLQSFDLSHSEETVVEEFTLTKCIEDVHKVFVSGEPHVPLLKFLEPVLPVLFELMCCTIVSISNIRNLCEEIILRFMRHTESGPVVSYLYNLTFNVSTKLPGEGFNAKCSFTLGSAGGFKVVKSDGSEETSFDARISCVIKLLKGIASDDVTANFFLRLLQDLSDVINKETDEKKGKEKDAFAPGETLYNIEQNINTQVEKITHGLMVVQVLAEMSEHVGPSCFKNTSHILEFAKVTLDRGVYVLQHTDDEEFGLFESETVSMAMGLLTAVMSGATKVTMEDRQKLNEMLPVLDTLSKQHPDDSVKEMATDLRIAIATHGHLLSDALKHVSKQKGKTNPKQSDEIKLDTGSDSKKEGVEEEKRKKPLIEVISSCDESEDFTPNGNKSDLDVETEAYKEHSNKSKPKATESASSEKSELEVAFEELLDPLVPVRGHALITLRRLLEAKDPEALEKQDVILKVFQENLDHADSYIYLSSIQGMSALADRIPDTVLPCLVQQYSTTSSWELRIKVGEVLVKACRNMGDMMPKYRDLFLNGLLSGARDKDPLVRASAMSNLGEVCKLLHFSLGNCIHEIFTCVKSLIQSDSDPEVRKSSAMFCTSLLQGLGQDTIKVLDTVLSDMYRVLKRSAQTEQNEAVLLHVRLALDELDQIMRQYLFPAQTLTKRIHVLDPPT